LPRTRQKVEKQLGNETLGNETLGNETLGNEKFDVFSSSAHLFI